MLLCRDGSYYVGSATGEDLTPASRGINQARILDTRRPAFRVKLVWSEYFLQITDAIATERKVKGWRSCEE
jgi:putative endonuclease